MSEYPDNLVGWLMNGERGVSSEYMASVIFDLQPGLCGNDIPYDPGDFNRCHKFLNRVPEARQHLDKLRKSGEVWNRYIDHWKEMESLFLNGRYEELYDLMNRLRGKEETS